MWTILLASALAFGVVQGGSVYGPGCTSGTCGVNAQCTIALGSRPVCSCLPHHRGDPLNHCRRFECIANEECSGNLACVEGNCINPCVKACGANANCNVVNHIPVCSCPAGFTGDPFTNCRVFNPEELCHPSPCGANTKCTVNNNVPTCSCLPGYTRGSPLTGCRHECESDGECGDQQVCENHRCTSACSRCGEGARCSTVRNHRAVCECPEGYIGNPLSGCRPECYGDVDCPSHRPACFYGICKNPCEGACGVRADCNLRGLTPVCSCPRDMTGDPFISCRPFEKRDLCEPNPCGANAKCTPGYDNTNKERPVCTCPPGYTGNSLVNCVRGECMSDAECPGHRACLAYKCIDPCIGHPCGQQATCQTREHIAVCTCPDGTQGDALVSCRTSRANWLSRYYYKK